MTQGVRHPFGESLRLLVYRNAVSPLRGAISVSVGDDRQRPRAVRNTDDLSASLSDQSDLTLLVAGRPAHLPRFLAAKYQPDPGLIDDQRLQSLAPCRSLRPATQR